MKELALSLLFFGVVVFALINLKPKEVERVVVKEVPMVTVKERVVVKEVVKEMPVVYKTVNHYHNDTRNVVYYQPPEESAEEPRVQRINFSYGEYESVKVEQEVEHEEITEDEPKVRMFFVDGISEPLWVEGDSR